MKKKYKNPPIVEAVCEFRFSEDSPWDLAMIGLIYDQVKETFPKRTQSKKVSLGVSSKASGIEQNIITIDKVIFSRNDEKASIQISPRQIAINHFKPYPAWEGFLPLIKLGLDAYYKVAEPKTIQRIGLRYINKIEFIEDSLELEDFFEFRPFIGENINQDIRNFIVGTEMPFEESRDILRLVLTSSKAEAPNKLGIILDLDYFLASPQELTIDNIIAWIDTAHKHLEIIFEASITDKLRKTF